MYSSEEKVSTQFYIIYNCPYSELTTRPFLEIYKGLPEALENMPDIRGYLLVQLCFKSNGKDAIFRFSAYLASCFFPSGFRPICFNKTKFVHSIEPIFSDEYRMQMDTRVIKLRLRFQFLSFCSSLMS